MPRRSSITADEAEQYELPELRRMSSELEGPGIRRQGRSSAEAAEIEDEDLDMDDLQKPLLAADGIDKEGFPEGGDAGQGETVGKGTKIDRLIAEVSCFALLIDLEEDELTS